MKTRSGFTMIELLVVIAIMVILYSVARPMLSQSSSKTREMECRTNLAQVAMAVRAYVDDYGVFPKDMAAIDSMVGNRAALGCPRTATPYVYKAPRGEVDEDTVILSCVDISRKAKLWPHRGGDSCLALTASGGVKSVSRR